MLAELAFNESTRLDPDALVALHREMGPAAAENVISRALDTITGRMVEAHALYRAGEMEALAKLSRGLVAIAQQIGMVRFSAVAHDVSICALAGDSVATGATLARLERVTEASLTALWDGQDMRI